MNAIPNFKAFNFAGADFEKASKAFGDVAENLQVLTDSLVNGVQGVERARAEVLATGLNALQLQATGIAALAQASGPKEALELQQQFARQAFEAHSASLQAFGGLAAAWTAAFQPLQERYAKFALAATQR